MDAYAVAVGPLTIAKGGNDDEGGMPKPDRCELLGPFALFVQGALGMLALLVLLWKRYRERPQRPILVWFMDASKQVFGAMLVHLANILLSMLSSGNFSTEPHPFAAFPPPPAPSQLIKRMVTMRSIEPETQPGDGGDEPYSANPCSFYVLNLAIDTTIGVLILIYILRGLNWIVSRLPGAYFKSGFDSGYYGSPKPRWGYWVKQCGVYFCGLMGMKIVVWGIFEAFPWLGRVGDWALGWTQGSKQLQVFFVMFFFPLVMNGFQYYVIDSYIKHKPPYDGSNLAEDPTPVDHHPRRDSSDSYSDLDGEDGQRLLRSPPQKPIVSSMIPTLLDDYDPELDGANDGANDGASTKGPLGKLQRPTSGKSRNSSMMLLPGSRGPSTPGYDDDRGSYLSGGRAGSAKSKIGKRGFGDDDSTLVGGDDK